jgi:ADP-L-glycero-D-manno-heptose 6-epimerase
VSADPLILVTGGAGFIGSNIVAELTARPTARIAVCDSFGDSKLGKWRNLSKHPIADWVAPENLWSWLGDRGRDVALVIHMGAISSTLEPDVDKIMSANFALSRDLFRWCSEKKRRFIYASSAATYGDGAGGYDDRQDLSYLTALRPLNAYGWSKALFDIFCHREAAEGRAPPQWTGLKFFNVFGPNEGHKGAMSSVAAQIWPQVLAGEAVKLFKSENPDYADGGQSRDFVYIRDVAECVAWLASADAPSGVYNLGSGTARSFADLARAVFAASGREPKIDYVDMPLGLKGQYQYFTVARMDRLRAAGWLKPSTSLEAAIDDYVRRYLNTNDPYF